MTLTSTFRYYAEYKSKQAEEERVQRDRDASTERDFSDTVQFSLCMMERRGGGKAIFKYTTLFEVPLRDLVKSSVSTLASVQEAALKTTREYPFLHTMSKGTWTDTRGCILNKLSERYSKGYLDIKVIRMPLTCSIFRY